MDDEIKRSRGGNLDIPKYAKFDDLAAKQLGFYVYALRDPRDGVVFYVGKGTNNRWFDHILEARTRPDDEKLKLSRIREIESSGSAVDAFLVRSGLANEKAAYEVEAAVIHAYRLLEKSSQISAVELTNLAEVHQPQRGLVDVRIAQTLFNAPPSPEITFPCGLFRIPQLWFPEMSDDQLREATSGWWSARSVAKSKKVAKYAFAVSRGVIRGAYAIEESMWRERRPGDRDFKDDEGKAPRWGFPDCRPAPEMSHFLNTSVKHLFKPGNANPIMFLNCGSTSLR
jgi:uncharacterized protein